MAYLENRIDTLMEIKNLDTENKSANIYIAGRYLFIRRPDQEDGYYIELKMIQFVSLPLIFQE